jgi:Flp pilus assembly protein TadD
VTRFEVRPYAGPMWLGLLMVPLLLAAGCGSPADRYPGDPADDQFEQAADRPPTANTLYSLARLLAAQGRDADCETVLKKVITEQPDYLPAYCDLAELRMRAGRTDDAIQVLTAGIHVAPKDPCILNNLGVCWMVKNNFGQALEMFTRAAAAAPANARYRANMALSLGMLGRYDESLALYEQVVPPHEAHYNLAVLCRARGDEERAKGEFAIARMLDGTP